MDENRIQGSARQTKGRVKEALGQATCDRKTRAEGRADKAAGLVCLAGVAVLILLSSCRTAR